MQSGPPAAQSPPQSDGAVMVHGLWPEDFLDRIVCLRCAEYARNLEGYNFDRYAKNVLEFHGVDLYAITSKESGEQEFLAWFSNQPNPNVDEPKNFFEKIMRWNKARKEFSEARDQ
jgi:hypothetical protein